MSILAPLLHPLHFSLLPDHFNVEVYVLVNGLHRLLENRHLAALRPDQSLGRGFVAKGPLYSLGHHAEFARADNPNILSHVNEPFRFVAPRKSGYHFSVKFAEFQ